MIVEYIRYKIDQSRNDEFEAAYRRETTFSARKSDMDAPFCVVLL